MRHRRLLRAALPAVAIGLLLSGCGGSKDKLTGTPKIPAGYEIVKGEDASFARPPDWRVETGSSGQPPTPTITASAPSPAGTTTPNVQLGRVEGIGDSFEASVTARLSFGRRDGEDRKEDKAKDVVIPGAERAILSRSEVTADGRRFSLFDLAVLRKDGAAVFFSGVAPKDGNVDLDAVLSTFRLNGQ